MDKPVLVTMHISGDVLPLYVKAGIVSKVTLRILNVAGEKAICIGGNTISITEGYFWIGVPEKDITLFWDAFSKLQ